MQDEPNLLCEVEMESKKTYLHDHKTQRIRSKNRSANNDK